jgi:transcriptional regulator with XRE-family HTH domain
VSEVRSPTLRRRELGARLRSMRLEHGLTVEQVAEQLLCSPSKVSRMETGQRAATLRDVRDLCGIYGVTDQAEITRLMDLAREGKQQAWWQPYDLDYFATYVDLEQAATGLSYYHTTVVPGLLQTVDYARAMFAWSLPTGQLGAHLAEHPQDRRDNLIEYTPERRDQLIDVRVRRQRQLLTRDPAPDLVAVLDEAVLHRVVGGPAIMGAQLRHLVEASARSNLALQVIPFGLGAHPAMDNIFTILEFEGAAPSIVYVEGLMGWLYLEREQEVARYGQVLEHLRSVALSPQETTELIKEISVRYDGAS